MKDVITKDALVTIITQESNGGVRSSVTGIRDEDQIRISNYTPLHMDIMKIK